MTTPQLVALAILASLPVLLVAALAIGRLASGWSALVQAYPDDAEPAADAHRVSGQPMLLGARTWLPGFVTVIVDTDNVWLRFAWPASWFFAPVRIPLEDVTLLTAEGEIGATRLMVAKVPDLRLLLYADGAQVVIVRAR